MFLVDNRPIVRRELRRTLERLASITVADEAPTCEEAVTKSDLQPDVTILGLGAHERGNIESIQALRRQFPRTKVLVLGARETPSQILTLLRAGANGYLPTAYSANELRLATTEVHNGKTFLSDTGTTPVPERPEVAEKSELEARSTLSPRESQVLRLIAEGMTNRQIGEGLGISARTVETHRERIMRKLDIHTVAGLTRYFITRVLDNEG